MQDAHAVERVLEGDSSAFEYLILKYQSQLLATAQNIVKVRENAEDLVQESFMKAYEKLETLKDPNQFYPWLKRITVNLALNYFDRSKRIVDVETEDGTGSYFDNVPVMEGPEDLALKEEMRRYVRTFVDSLPDRLRVVVILREVEDLSYEEISDMLKIPLGTVRSRLFNARQIVKERLVRQGLADGMYREA